MPRGSWAAWAGRPQALSHAAATTCRVSTAACKARRGSPKVAPDGTFTAKFQHLYTTLAWRFLGWSSRDIDCCELLRGSRPVNRQLTPATSGLPWGLMVLDLGELCTRIWCGSRVVSSGRW